MSPQFLLKLLTEFATNDLHDPDAEVSIRRTAHGRLYAILTSNQFDDMELTARQDRIWTFLRQRLSVDERMEISAVYAKGVSEAVVEDYSSDRSPELSWRS